MEMFLNTILVILSLLFFGLWVCLIYEHIRDFILDTQEPECPNCGDWLIEEDTWDIETLTDDSAIVTKHLGTCPTCNKKFQWQAKYNKNKVFDIEEVK